MSTERGLTIPEFCRKHGISRAFYYLLKKRGLGPREYRIGAKLVRISEQSEAAWLSTWQQPADLERIHEVA